MNLFQMSVRNLVGRPARSLLTMVSVCLTVGAFVALFGIAGALEGAFRNGMQTRGSDLLISEAGVAILFESHLSETLARDVAAISGVAAATPELARMAPGPGGTRVLATGWPPDSYLWKTLTVTSGRLPEPDESDVVVLGENLANLLKLTVGSRLSLFYENFQVVGIVTSPSIFNRSLAIAPLADIQRLTLRDGIATNVQVKLRSGLGPDERQRTLAAIGALAKGYLVETTEDVVTNNRVLQIARAVSWSISLIVLVVGVIGIVNTLSMATNERQREFALLAAVGWSPRRILSLVLMEEMLLVVLSAMVGVALGATVAWIVSRLPDAQGFLEPALGWFTMLKVLLASVLLGMLGAAYPALRAVAADPATHLRGT